MKKAHVVIKKKGDKGAQIEIKDDLSIQAISEIDAQLKEALSNYESFVFQVHEVNTLDLSFMQLLYAFKIAADESNKSTTFEFDLDEEHKNLLNQAGFDKYFQL